VRGKALLFGAACLLAAVSAAAQEQVLRVAVSRGLTGTGLLEAIASDAKAEAGITVDWEAAGPEGAVSLAETCGADALLINDPEVAKLFMEQGKGAIRLRVMFSDYVLLGPAGDPAGASGKIDADAGVRDQYDAIAVNPDLCPRGRFDLTVRFLQWIVSPAEQRRIGRFTYRGFPLFFPNAGTETCPTCQ
jgi:ABC-type tungstate transport system permease subunit